MIYLIRHATSIDQVLLPKLVSGKRDIVLNDFGIKEAKEWGQNNKRLNISKVYTSNLQRAENTARCILSGMENKVEVVKDELLNEIDYGIFDGKEETILKEAKRKYHSQNSLVDFNIKYDESMESYVEGSKRIVSFLEKIKNESGNILVVSHSGIIKSLLFCHFGLERSRIEGDIVFGKKICLDFKDGKLEFIDYD